MVADELSRNLILFTSVLSDKKLPLLVTIVVISNYSLTCWASIISGRIMIKFIAVGRFCRGEIA